MNCEAVVERLPWLLNRSLPADEEETVRLHVSGCGACREELQRTGWYWEVNRLHLTPEAVVAHVAGDSVEGLPGDEIAAHLAECPSCAEERDLAAAGRFQAGGVPDRRVRGAGNGWRIFAVAASLFGMVVLAGYVQQRGRIEELLGGAGERGPGLQGPRLNVPIFELAPGEELRGDAVPREILLPGDAQSVMLILLPGRVPDGLPLQVTLRGAAGEAVWSGGGLTRSPMGDFTVELPASILEPGPMRLEITAGADGEPVERYDVMVRRAQP